MRCRIVGCGHTKSKESINGTRNSWEQFQICGCCAIELFYLGSIPTYRLASQAPRRCLRTIALEGFSQ